MAAALDLPTSAAHAAGVACDDRRGRGPAHASATAARTKPSND